MGSNIEIKAKMHDPEKQHQLAKELSDKPVAVLHQVDTFFQSPHGRLKLRKLSPTKGELIFYRRADRHGPMRSDYQIVPTDKPDELGELLARALGILGTVEKKRHLYQVGQTRIHVDNVEGLGWFIELEVVLRPEQSDQEGERIARELMKRLHIRKEDLIDRAYIDLIIRPA